MIDIVVKKNVLSNNIVIDNTKTNHKIILGDSKEKIKTIDKDSVKLIFTSPPYESQRDYSSWDNIEDYFKEMKSIFSESS